MTPEQFRKLQKLTDARKNRDLAALEAATAEDRRLLALIEELRRVPARDLAEGGLGVHPAQIAARLAWAEARIAETQAARDRLAARIDTLRRTAAVSLGKNEAMAELSTRATSAREKTARSRRDAEAPPPRAPLPPTPD